jgi:hypothetical protein
MPLSGGVSELHVSSQHVRIQPMQVSLFVLKEKNAAPKGGILVIQFFIS